MESIVVGLVLPAVVSLLQQAIPAAISKLKARFQRAKATEEETRELGDFLRCVQDCSTKYEVVYAGTVKTTTNTPSVLEKTLDDVQKTLDRWSSQNSMFFSLTSGYRVQKLRDLRHNVDRSITMEIMVMLRDQQRMLNSIRDRMRKMDGQAPIMHPPLIDTPTPVDKPHYNICTTTRDTLSLTTITTTTDEVSTDLVRSKCIGRASTNPSKPILSRIRSKSAERNRRDSNEKWRTEELWVSLHSECQVREMETILYRLPGVKRVSCDMITKKVTVILGEESTVDTAKLLEVIEREQRKGKEKPKPWSERLM